MILKTPRDTTTYKISGTETFRLSSGMLLQHPNKTLENRNYGGARQNIEKSMRFIWEADPGYSLVQVDQAGAEALIVAHLCRRGKYRELFECGIKPHTYLALKLFPKVWISYFSATVIADALIAPISELAKKEYWPDLSKYISSSDDWPDNERYYFFAKGTIHMRSYGGQAKRFREKLFKDSGGRINISMEQASKFLMAFDAEFPEIAEWHKDVYKEYERTGMLRNLLGFPYIITHFVKKDDFKELIAWKPQSTVACINRQGVVKLYKHIQTKKPDWHFLGDCHDSILSQAPDAEAEELAKKIKEFIEIEMTGTDGTKFRMKSEAAIGKNWGSYSEKNPNGLKKIK